ncbi:MAG: hypothetical protein C0460_17175 [Methylibium sp.]|nr:hypothetical protein [Methylibium sp.]
MDHKLYQCRGCSANFCPFCMGGLKFCTVCNGAEGTLTTHCTGARLSVPQELAVKAGRLDYANGLWVHYGFLAQAVHGKRLPLVALASNDGFYLGTAEGESTVTQESTESFASAQLALEALASGSWTQRAKA